MNGTGTPLSFGTELFQGDLDRLEEHLMHCAELIPQFGTCGIQAVINGPVSWPPDGNPILGPVHDDKVRNYWAACGMSYGIAHAGYQSMLSIQSIILFVFVNSQDAAMFSRQVFGTVTTFFKTFSTKFSKTCIGINWLLCTGGASKYLVDWIQNGEPPTELFECDPTRFGRWATKQYTCAKIRET